MPETYEEVKFTNPPGRKPDTRRRKVKPPVASKTELQRGFFHGFRGFSLAVRSTETIPETEFSEMASAYEDLVKRFPVLGWVILALAPLSVAGETWDKVNRIWGQRTRFFRKPKDVVDAEQVILNANDNAPNV